MSHNFQNQKLFQILLYIMSALGTGSLSILASRTPSDTRPPSQPPPRVGVVQTSASAARISAPGARSSQWNRLQQIRKERSGFQKVFNGRLSKIDALKVLAPAFSEGDPDPIDKRYSALAEFLNTPNSDCLFFEQIVKNHKIFESQLKEANLSSRNCDFTKLVLSETWYPFINSPNTASSIKKELQNSISQLKKQTETKNFLAGLPFFQQKKEETREIFGALTQKILNLNGDALVTLQDKIKNKNFLFFQQIYFDRVKQQLGFKYRQYPATWFGKTISSNSRSKEKYSYQTAPHLQAFDETCSNLAYQLRTERAEFEREFRTFFIPHELGSISFFRDMKEEISLKDFIIRDSRLSMAERQKTENTVCNFVLDYHKAGAPSGGIDLRARTELYTLSNRYNIIYFNQRTEENENDLRESQKNEILTTPNISKFVYQVLKSKDTFHKQLAYDYEGLTFVLQNALETSEFISKITAEYVMSKLTDPSNRPDPKQYQESLNYAASLGSPGLDLEIGEFQFWNVLDFFNKLNALKETNFFVQELMKSKQAFFLKKFCDELIISSLANLEIEIPKITEL